MDNDGIKIDGIPIEDYNVFTSKTIYNDGICISEIPTVKPGIYFDGVKITTVEEWDKAIEEFRKRANEFIPKQKVRDKIKELKREFDFYAGREHSEWEDGEFDGEVCDDIALKIGVLKELLKEEK